MRIEVRKSALFPSSFPRPKEYERFPFPPPPLQGKEEKGGKSFFLFFPRNTPEKEAAINLPLPPPFFFSPSVLRELAGSAHPTY